MASNDYIMSLDIGEKRVGVAMAGSASRLARPLTTLSNDQGLIQTIKDLIKSNQVATLVVGLPRRLGGQDSEQTKLTLKYVDTLKRELTIPVVTQDEALSSIRAEEELKSRDKLFARADIDKLAACLILEDYLNEQL